VYLSYSGFSVFRQCARAYYYRYIGKPKLPEPGNRVHMLYGDVVGKLFEKYYEDRIWTKRNAALHMLDLVRPVLNKVVVQEIRRGGVFDWNEPGLKPGSRSIEEVEQEVRETIPRGIRGIKAHRLMGVEAHAEVVLNTSVRGHTLAGRADFIIRRIKPHNDLVLLDGKGSRWRDRYTDERQLRWYAMLYQMKKGVVPDRLAFLYWRFEPKECLDWVDATQKQLDDLKNAALEAIGKIEGAKRKLRGSEPGVCFLASPGSNCRLCDFQAVCPEGTRVLSDNTKTQILEDRNRGVEEGEVSF